MFTSGILSRRGLLKTASFIAFSLMLAAPYGCSKGGEQSKEQPAAVQAPAADPGKEHFDKGVQFSLKGQLDDAIREYEAVLTYNPKSAEAHNNLGFAYFDKGDIDKAIEHQKHAVESNPNLANGYYGLALALEKKGDKKGAIENWKQFAALSQPHSKWWMKAQEHIQALEGKGVTKTKKSS
jgi:tetratricopeptide (TPR) repeat protein